MRTKYILQTARHEFLLILAFLTHRLSNEFMSILIWRVLWELYPSYHNGFFSPLLVRRDFATRGRSISVLSKQYETSYLFYVTLHFLCNIICYLISVFAFLLLNLSGATTVGNRKILYLDRVLTKSPAMVIWVVTDLSWNPPKPNIILFYRLLNTKQIKVSTTLKKIYKGGTYFWQLHVF